MKCECVKMCEHFRLVLDECGYFTINKHFAPHQCYHSSKFMHFQYVRHILQRASNLASKLSSDLFPQLLCSYFILFLSILHGLDPSLSFVHIFSVTLNLARIFSFFVKKRYQMKLQSFSLAFHKTYLVKFAAFI